MKTQKQEDTLDTLVRDLTTVHPMPKSEVRRRLSDFIECAKAEERERVVEEALSLIGQIGVGGRGKYQDGFREALEMAADNVQTLQEGDNK